MVYFFSQKNNISIKKNFLTLNKTKLYKYKLILILFEKKMN